MAFFSSPVAQPSIPFFCFGHSGLSMYFFVGGIMLNENLCYFSHDTCLLSCFFGLYHGNGIR